MKLLFIYFYFFLFWLPCGMWRSPDQGSDLSCSCGLCRSCGNARSLTYCPRAPETLPVLCHSENSCFICLKPYFFFFGCTCGMWKFLGQELNLCHSSDPGHSSNNATSSGGCYGSGSVPGPGPSICCGCGQKFFFSLSLFQLFTVLSLSLFFFVCLF